MGDIGGADAGPVRNEEAAGVLLDGSPVALAIHAFKGRDEGFVVVAVLRAAGGRGEGVDGVGCDTGVPLAVGFVVKGEEEAEVAVVFGGLGGEVDGGGGVGVAGGDVQGESVDADVGGFGDVAEPVVVCTASSIANL